MRAINCAVAVSSLRSIRAHGRYDDDGDGVRVSSHYAQTTYVGSGVKSDCMSVGEIKMHATIFAL